MQQQVKPATTDGLDLDAISGPTTEVAQRDGLDLDNIGGTSAGTDVAIAAKIAELTPIKLGPQYAGALIETRLEPQEKEEIRKRAAGVNFRDALAMSTFSEASQAALSGELTKMQEHCGQVRNLGSVGDIILKVQRGSAIIDELKKKAGEESVTDDQIRKPEEKKSWGRQALDALQDVKILGIGKAVSRAELEHLRNQELGTIFAGLQDGLKARRREQIQSIVVLNQNEAAVKKNIRDQILYVLAGQYAIQCARKEYETLKEDPRVTRDPMKVVELLQMKENIETFSRKLVEIAAWIVELSFSTLPRINAMRQVVLGTFDSLSTTLQRTVPRLQQSAIDCGILFRALDGQESVSSLQQLDSDVARQAGQVYRQVAIAGEKAKGAIHDQVKVLGEMGQFFLDTQAEVARIAAENEEKVAETEQALVAFAQKMNAGLQSRL